jgi:hypothetical protein
MSNREVKPRFRLIDTLEDLNSVSRADVESDACSMIGFWKMQSGPDTEAFDAHATGLMPEATPLLHRLHAASQRVDQSMPVDLRDELDKLPPSILTYVWTVGTRNGNDKLSKYIVQHLTTRVVAAFRKSLKRSNDDSHP